MKELVLAGEGAQIRLAVFGYENPSAAAEPDADWLTCEVSLRIGAASADYDAAFTTEEIAALQADLQPVLALSAANASFNALEGALAFDLAVSRTGAVRITGRAMIEQSPRVELTFTVESDLSRLESFARDLKRAIAAYPIRLPSV